MKAEKLKWNRTPYDTSEAEYKSGLIIYSSGEYYPKGLSVAINGDILHVHTIDEAKKVIDTMEQYANAT